MVLCLWAKRQKQMPWIHVGKWLRGRVCAINNRCGAPHKYIYRRRFRESEALTSKVCAKHSEKRNSCECEAQYLRRSTPVVASRADEVCGNCPAGDNTYRKVCFLCTNLQFVSLAFYSFSMIHTTVRKPFKDWDMNSWGTWIPITWGQATANCKSIQCDSNRQWSFCAVRKCAPKKVWTWENVGLELKVINDSALEHSIFDWRYLQCVTLGFPIFVWLNVW